MARCIPPRTMKDVSRAIHERDRTGKRGGLRLRLGVGGQPGGGKKPPPSDPAFPTEPFRKPRDWRFQTKPLFRKIREPLVDVFHEAEEVLIIIDLGGFCRGDVSLKMTPDSYLIHAKRGDHEFREEIRRPPEVDVERCVEHFRNGVLEIILPRKKDRQER